MVTDAQLARIMPNLPQAKREAFLPFLNQAMDRFEINTALRTAAFLAQLAHESGQFRFMEEIWGPTDAQKRYEPPSTLAARLGNTQPGDGFRFKGRGPIQITGRFNYKKYGDLLGVDLIAQPEQAATPNIGFATAGLYWKTNGLNELADRDDFITVTKRINGGINGLADRQKYYATAKQVLATDFVAGSGEAVTRGMRAPAAPANVPAGPLARGFEVIGAEKPAAKPKTKTAKAKPAAAVKSRSAKGVKRAVGKAAKKTAKKAVKKTVARKAAVKKHR